MVFMLIIASKTRFAAVPGGVQRGALVPGPIVFLALVCGLLSLSVGDHVCIKRGMCCPPRGPSIFQGNRTAVASDRFCVVEQALAESRRGGC
jgi:hypothetical protein